MYGGGWIFLERTAGLGLGYERVRVRTRMCVYISFPHLRERYKHREMPLCCKKHSSVQAKETETDPQPQGHRKQRSSSPHTSRGLPLQLLLPWNNLLIWQEKWKIKIFVWNIPVLKCWYKCLKILFKPGKIWPKFATLDTQCEKKGELLRILEWR